MADKPRILIVDDDPVVAESLAEYLSREGYVTATAMDGSEAMGMLDGAAETNDPVPASKPASPRRGDGEKTGETESNAPFGLVITDLNMPRLPGLELIKSIKKKHPSVSVIVITGFGKIETAVEAVKAGAVEYLTKPVVDDELRVAVSKALQQHALLAENETLREQLNERFGLGNLVGADYRMQKIYDLVESVAESKTTVLIDGESGTGKTMVARVIHTLSPRRTGPFITFSCGSIPETLLESELFGHVKGAFTGADVDKPGKCLAANGGTLFIDEINSATPALQLKLLRVLQEKQFEPVGSTKTVSVDVRFVLAANQPLADLVAKGQFREDLYYRINVVSIRVPPLRDRLGDIQLLVDNFLKKYCHEVGKDRVISEQALNALRGYRWPGNVRELENAIERAVVLSKRAAIEVDDLPDPIRAAVSGASGTAGAAGLATQAAAVNGTSSAGVALIPALTNGWTPMPLERALEEPEKQIILAALKANHWNRQETAKQLDINRTTLYKKIKQYALDVPEE